jgi:hypothetical protein
MTFFIATGSSFNREHIVSFIYQYDSKVAIRVEEILTVVV